MGNRVKIICLSWVAFQFFGLADELVAGYGRDYRAQAPLVSGWSYLWNSPADWVPGKLPYNMWSGQVGHPGCYLPLKEAGGVWTADGDRKGENSSPDRYLSLNSTGGHPGGGDEVYRNYEGRAVIVAYTVSEPGVYELSGSQISVRESDVGDGVELVVHVNGNEPLLREQVSAGETKTFNLSLGALVAGDTVYVGAGPWIKCYADGFLWDFSILRKD